MTSELLASDTGDLRVASDSNLWKRIRSAVLADRLAVAGLLFLTCLVLIAIFGPMFSPYTPTDIVRDASGRVLVQAAPSLAHPLGTTAFGQDILSQMIYGTRPVMIVGFACAVLPIVVGYALGLIAGYMRGWIDMVISRTVEIWYSIPADPFAIVLLVILEPSLATLILAISLTYWRRPTRAVRNVAFSLSQSLFIKSARVNGAGPSWVIWRHLVPLTLPLAFVYVPIGFANAVLAEASLSFLGFGDPDQISWGGIMQNAFNGGALQQSWWWIVTPGIAITVTAVAIFLITRPIEEVIDPRLRGRSEAAEAST